MGEPEEVRQRDVINYSLAHVRERNANGVWGGRFQNTYFDVRVFPPLTETMHWRQCTENINLGRSRLTSSGYKRWSTLPSLPLFIQPQEVWAMKPPSFKSVWHCCLLKNGIPHTARLYVGYCAACAIPSFTHPSKQLEVPDPLRDMQ